jgi:hypothetical protein
MDKHDSGRVRYPSPWALATLLTLPLAAHVDAGVIDENLNFATVNQNLWGPGTATVIDESVTIPPPDGIHASPSLDSFKDPTSALASFLGIDIGASFSPTATIDAGLTASFHANTGSIDLNYPANVQLTLPNSVTAGQSFTVSATPPGPVSLGTLATIPVSNLINVGGGGYAAPGLGQFLTQTVGSVIQPTAGFTTVFPYAEAKVDLNLQAAGSIASRVCLVFCFDGPTVDLGSVDLSQQLFELSTLNGLQVLDQAVVPFNQTVPVAQGVSIGFSSPNISLNGVLGANGLLSDTAAKNFLDFSFNVDQLIPLVGQLLQSNIGPVGYDLLSVSPTISLGIQQTITFDPRLMVALQFDAPVLDSRTNQLTNIVTFAIGDSVTLTPTVGGAILPSDLGVKPTFFLDNTIHNTTTLVLGGTLTVQALSLDVGATLGPAFGPQTFDLGDIPLLALDDTPWTLSIPTITGQAQTIQRTGTGLQLQNLDFFVDPVGSDTNGQGHSKYDLFAGNTLVAQVFGQIVKTGGFGCAGSEIPSPLCQTMFVSDDEVFGFNQEDLGRYFCLACNDLSSNFLATSPFLTDALSGDSLFLSDLTKFDPLTNLNDLLDPASPLYDAQLAATQYFQTIQSSTARVIPAPAQVPEPNSLVLIATGIFCIALRRRLAPTQQRA